MLDDTTTPQKLHYRLTTAEWIQVVNTLKPAELRVLYYLCTLALFGDRQLHIGVRETAQKLAMNPGTVSRALKTLGEQGWIDLELLQVKVRKLVRCRQMIAERWPAADIVAFLRE
jgi:DNA-binding MurR/RpiR family transcriptional regulator